MMGGGGRSGRIRARDRAAAHAPRVNAAIKARHVEFRRELYCGRASCHGDTGKGAAARALKKLELRLVLPADTSAGLSASAHACEPAFSRISERKRGAIRAN